MHTIFELMMQRLRRIRAQAGTTDKAVLAVAAFILSAALVPDALNAYKHWTAAHPLLSAFLKFGVLATGGECLALRMVSGRYSRPGFGLPCRFLAWGALGMTIVTAFTVFAAGTGAVLAMLGAGPDMLASTWGAVAKALCTSVLMNTTFGPVLMVAHKLSDMHIEAAGGNMRRCLSTMPDMADSLARIDWKVMWGFVIKKTIPFFWIPAHTVTFLLPPHFQIVFAALLGVALGLILAHAARRT